MKATKSIEELDEQTCSVMRYLEGQEIVARLDWDENFFYVWFEPSYAFESFCDEIGRDDLLTGLQNDLDQIGIHRFTSLDGVNWHCQRYCGDNEPAEFYWDGDSAVGA